MKIDTSKIEKAVQEVEKKTSGEIVPMIVEASDSYPGISWACAFIFAWLATILFYTFSPNYHLFIYFLFEILALWVGIFLLQTPLLKRALLPRKKMEEEVFQRALEAFYTYRLHETRDRNGILIFVSLLERRVQILADSGIDTRVPLGTWKNLVSQFSEVIRQGRLIEGFVETIEKCGKILSEHYPIRPDDVNELGNKVLRN